MQRRADRTNCPAGADKNSQFDQLTGLLDQLSPETRKALAETFAAIRPNLDQLLDKALGVPGVSAVIKPAVDAIRPGKSDKSINSANLPDGSDFLVLVTASSTRGTSPFFYRIYHR
jgi:hypothetical protein